MYVLCGPPSSGKTAYCERKVRESSDTRFRTSYQKSLYRGKAQTVAHLKRGAAAVFVDEQHAACATRRELIKHVSQHDPAVKLLCLHFLPDGGAEQVRWAYECALASAMALGVHDIGVEGGPPELLTGADVDGWFGSQSATRAPQQVEGEGCAYASPPEQIRCNLDPSLVDAPGTPAIPARDGLFLDAGVLADASSQHCTAALHSTVAAWLGAHPNARVAVMLVQQTPGDSLPDAVYELAKSLVPKHELYFSAQATADDTGRPIDVRFDLGIFLARRHGVPPERALCVGRGAPTQQLWASQLPQLPFVSGAQFISSAAQLSYTPGYSLPTFVPHPSARTGVRLPDSNGKERAGERHGRLHGHVNLADRPVVDSSGVALLDPFLLTEADLARFCTLSISESKLLGKAVRELQPERLTSRSLEGKILKSTYAGSRPKPYEITVCVGERQPCKLVASSSCDCPQGEPVPGVTGQGNPASSVRAVCKHVFYVLLAYARDPQSFVAPSPTALAPLLQAPLQAVPQLDVQPPAVMDHQPKLQERHLPFWPAQGAKAGARSRHVAAGEGSAAASAGLTTVATARTHEIIDLDADVDLDTDVGAADGLSRGKRRLTDTKGTTRVDSEPEPPLLLDAPYPQIVTGGFLLKFATQAAARPKRAPIAPCDPATRPLDPAVMPAEETPTQSLNSAPSAAIAPFPAVLPNMTPEAAAMQKWFGHGSYC